MRINELIKKIQQNNEEIDDLIMNNENLTNEVLHNSKVDDDIHKAVVQFVESLSITLQVENNDQGPFDSKFCSHVERRIKSALNFYIHTNLNRTED